MEPTEYSIKYEPLLVVIDLQRNPKMEINPSIKVLGKMTISYQSLECVE